MKMGRDKDSKEGVNESSFWTDETLALGCICYDEIQGLLECSFCDFSTFYRSQLLRHLGTKHPRSRPDAANETIVDGRTSSSGGPKIRVAHCMSQNWFPNDELAVGSPGTSVCSSPSSPTVSDEPCAGEKFASITTDPKQSVLSSKNRGQPTTEEMRQGFRLVDPVIQEFACLFCEYKAFGLGSVLMHSRAEHNFMSCRNTAAQSQNKDLPPLASGSLGEQRPSPELNLHLSEDEEDVADEPTKSIPDLNQSRLACPYCPRSPLSWSKIRKHICRHFKDHFVSEHALVADGRRLVCKLCLVKSLGRQPTGEGGVFVTKNPIHFSRHLGLRHNLLDNTIIECGQTLRPRLSVTLRKRVNWDDPCLDDTWEVSRPPRVALGALAARQMFTSHVRLRRINKKTVSRAIRIIKANKIVQIQCPKITPNQLIRNSARQRTKPKPVADTKRVTATRGALTPSVTSLVVTQAGSSRVKRGRQEFLKSEVFLTLRRRHFSTDYHALPVKPLPISSEIGCARWRSQRSSESGKPIKMTLVMPDSDKQSEERIVPFELM